MGGLIEELVVQNYAYSVKGFARDLDQTALRKARRWRVPIQIGILAGFGKRTTSTQDLQTDDQTPPRTGPWCDFLLLGRPLRDTPSFPQRQSSAGIPGPHYSKNPTRKEKPAIKLNKIRTNSLKNFRRKVLKELYTRSDTDRRSNRVIKTFTPQTQRYSVLKSSPTKS